MDPSLAIFLSLYSMKMKVKLPVSAVLSCSRLGLTKQHLAQSIPINVISIVPNLSAAYRFHSSSSRLLYRLPPANHPLSMFDASMPPTANHRIFLLFFVVDTKENVPSKE